MRVNVVSLPHPSKIGELTVAVALVDYGAIDASALDKQRPVAHQNHQASEVEQPFREPRRSISDGSDAETAFSV
jgi:hypothetical protein